MKILIISATRNEISPVHEWLLQRQTEGKLELMISGIGCTATAYHLTKKLNNEAFDLVIQVGICGSFSSKIEPGATVLVGEELFADLGALDNGSLTDIFDLGLAGSDDAPFNARMLKNPRINEWEKYGLRIVRSATVNNITSTPVQVNAIIDKYQPQIEAMEGAAMHYVCLMQNIPFLQMRSVSNFAGERNKANWKMREAITQLNHHLKIILEDVLKG